MKKEDIPKLKIAIMKTLPSLQSDIWKKTNIDRRTCSKLMKILKDEHVIKRTKVKGGSYMIERIDVKNTNLPNQIRFSSLLSNNGKFSPCTACVIDCNPETCNIINNWILDIRS